MRPIHIVSLHYFYQLTTQGIKICLSAVATTLFAATASAQAGIISSLIDQLTSALGAPASAIISIRSGLSTGAKAGIGVGAALGFIILAALPQQQLVLFTPHLCPRVSNCIMKSHVFLPVICFVHLLTL
jgi:hypothetical protein